MDIGFIHTEMLAVEGVGSHHSATKIAFSLANAGHDITVYCPVSRDKVDGVGTNLPLNIEIEFLEPRESITKLPEGDGKRKGRSVIGHTEQFDSHDLLHSYISDLPSLATVRNQIDTPMIVSLNAFRPVCPKGDLFYKNTAACRTNSLTRCSKCIMKTTIYPEQGDLFDGASIYEAYDGVMRFPATFYRLLKRFQNLRTVQKNKDVLGDIDMYHLLAPHLTDIFTSFGFPEEKLRVFPNILDERFLVPHRSDFAEPYRLLYVGTLRKKKGPQKLPKILEYLTKTYDETYELTIVGDGYLQSRLEREIDKKNLNATVRGRVSYENLPEVYANHDIFIYTGIWEEPFGRVFLESLAAGTPIVSSDIGSAEAIIGDAGVLTNGSIEDFGETIHELVEGNTLADRSPAAKRKATEYKPDVLIDDLEQIYRETIASK